MRIQVVVAHPDDAAFTCGGTLAKHADRGDDVTVTYLTRGEWGGDANEDERAATREQEARNCVDELGGTATFLDGKDGRLSDTFENRVAVVEALRSNRPDIVITWYPDDPHPDHRITSQLVQDAAFQISTANLETESPPATRPNIYFVGKPQTSFDPTMFIDIGDYHDRKIKALYEHETEIERIEQKRGMNVSDVISSRAKAYGHRCGVHLAEGFIPDEPSATDYLR
ncbi:PIG-L deacetylase family protein [Haladaptatus sp. NG-SE-30]